VGAGAEAVNVNFATDDGNPASGLTVDLDTLPAGWSSTITAFSCAAVSVGNGCQLPLSYAPATASSGTLGIGYSYRDNSGATKSGTLSIPYTATTHNDVVATASPGGQVNAVVGAGNRPVTVGFTTNDGNPATALALTLDLTALPPAERLAEYPVRGDHARQCGRNRCPFRTSRCDSGVEQPVRHRDLHDGRWECRDRPSAHQQSRLAACGLEHYRHRIVVRRIQYRQRLPAAADIRAERILQRHLDCEFQLPR
jgi:hypothetical protein